MDAVSDSSAAPRGRLRPSVRWLMCGTRPQQIYRGQLRRFKSVRRDLLVGDHREQGWGWGWGSETCHVDLEVMGWNEQQEGWTQFHSGALKIKGAVVIDDINNKCLRFYPVVDEFMPELSSVSSKYVKSGSRGRDNYIVIIIFIYIYYNYIVIRQNL